MPLRTLLIDIFYTKNPSVLDKRTPHLYNPPETFSVGISPLKSESRTTKLFLKITSSFVKFDL
jgi:hypothetical protein